MRRQDNDQERELYERVARIIEEARGHTKRAVDTVMVHAYWTIGQEIVEVEQSGKVRAEYRARIIKNLSRRLIRRFGRGCSVTNLQQMRKFYQTYPSGSALTQATEPDQKHQPVADVFNENRNQLKSKSEAPGDSDTVIANTERPPKEQAVPVVFENCQNHMKSNNKVSVEGAETGAPSESCRKRQTASGVLGRHLGASPESGAPGKQQAPPAVLEGEQAGALFPNNLGWTHYSILMRVRNPAARAFYEIEAARQGWATRELERQMASLLYERLARSRDKEGVLALAREGQEVTRPGDVIKDPVVLEFLGLEERPHWRERDLEQAIIDRLQAFLLELGRGFCFVARQKRITLDGDHFWVDLVLYNRLLRCFVLIDLKLGKLSHQDLGQIQMYVNYYDRFEREEWEAPTVGIVLCSARNEAVVRITLPEDNEQIHAARYQLVLPSEEELAEALRRERRRLEGRSD